jgi:hypothetical protein
MSRFDEQWDEVDRDGKSLHRGRQASRAMGNEMRAEYYRKRVILHSVEYFGLTASEVGENLGLCERSTPATFHPSP